MNYIDYREFMNVLRLMRSIVAKISLHFYGFIKKSLPKISHFSVVAYFEGKCAACENSADDVCCGFHSNWLSPYLFYVFRPPPNPSNIFLLSNCPWKLFSKHVKFISSFASEKKRRESIDQVQVQMNSRYNVRAWNKMFKIQVHQITFN